VKSISKLNVDLNVNSFYRSNFPSLQKLGLAEKIADALVRNLSNFMEIIAKSNDKNRHRCYRIGTV